MFSYCIDFRRNALQKALYFKAFTNQIRKRSVKSMLIIIYLKKCPKSSRL